MDAIKTTRPGAARNSAGPKDSQQGEVQSVADDRVSRNPSVAQSEIPVINVWLEPGSIDIVGFNCPFCEYRGLPVRHQHGCATAWLAPLGSVLGHRTSHCGDPKNFPNGYMLKLVGTAPATKPARAKATPRRSPAAQKRLDQVVTYEHAERIVRAIAERDDRFFLVKAVPDESGCTEPDALCDSRSMTIAVPPHGVCLGSLIAELALLHIGGAGAPWIDYPKLKAEIEKLVLPLAKELPR